MTDMIERAGRAALCGWNNVPRDNATMAAEWERMGPATREAWMRAMRAAIEAMREPTEAMEAAGRDALLPWLPDGRIARPVTDQWQIAREIHAAMIDSALNPTDEPGKD